MVGLIDVFFDCLKLRVKLSPNLTSKIFFIFLLQPTIIKLVLYDTQKKKPT